MDGKGYREFVLTRKENGMVFFSTQAMCTRPSLISGSLLIVLLRVVPLPQELKVADESPVSTEESAGKWGCV